MLGVTGFCEEILRAKAGEHLFKEPVSSCMMCLESIKSNVAPRWMLKKTKELDIPRHPNTWWGSVFEPPNISWGSAFRGSFHTDPHRVWLEDFGCLGHLWGYIPNRHVAWNAWCFCLSKWRDPPQPSINVETETSWVSKCWWVLWFLYVGVEPKIGVSQNEWWK